MVVPVSPVDLQRERVMLQMELNAATLDGENGKIELRLGDSTLRLDLQRLMELSGQQGTHGKVELEQMLKELGIATTITIDSLRSLERVMQLDAEDDPRHELRELELELHRGDAKARNLRIQIDKNSVEMNEILDRARQALDSATMSLNQADSLVTNAVVTVSVIEGKQGHGAVAISKVGAANGNKQCRVIVRTDSNEIVANGGEGHGRHIIRKSIITSSTSGNGQRTIVVNDADGKVLTIDTKGPETELEREAAEAMRADAQLGRADAELARANAEYERAEAELARGNSELDREESGNHRGVYVFELRRGTNTPSVTDGTLAIPEGFGVSFTDHRLVVGNDTILLHDGQDRQMVVRMSSDSSANGRVHVVVISTLRKNPAPENSASTQASAPATIGSAAGYQLGANVPNPFSGATSISFTLPTNTHANLAVFDASGKMVTVLADADFDAGTHSVSFDGSGLPSGLYMYRLTAGTFIETKTMTLTK